VILNAYDKAGWRRGPDRVYVGRGSKWANRFKIPRDGTRDEVIEKYRAWIVQQPTPDGGAARVRRQAPSVLVRTAEVHAKVRSSSSPINTVAHHLMPSYRVNATNMRQGSGSQGPALV
jgi:hypothetical protein